MNASESRLSELALNGIILTPVSESELKGTWTRFFDVHSGGYGKEPWDSIIIQAPREEAIRVFKTVFGHSPNAVACDCCGSNYGVIEDDEIEWSNNKRILYIKASDILEDWKE